MHALERVVRICFALFVHLPLWIVFALPRRNRPRPTWSVTRTVVLWFIRYTESVGLVGIDVPDHTAIVGGKGVKGVWVPPAAHLVHGEVKEWADLAGIECVRMPGYWQDKRGSDIPVGAMAADGEKVIYHLHGGAFARFSAHPNDTSVSGPRAILDSSRTIQRLFNLEYRRTGGTPSAPTNPFPAALLDAIAGYDYLVNSLGFAPENIVLTGDSSGGNLALALSRYLVEQRAQGDTSIPLPPGAMVLISPWVDLSVRGHEPSCSLYTNADSDYVDPHGVPWILTTRQYLGPLGWHAADTNRYISPASELLHAGEISFDGFPRTMILAGSAEVFRDQIRVLYERMVKDLGEKHVEYHEFPDAVHNFLAIPMLSEQMESVKLVREWIDPE